MVLLLGLTGIFVITGNYKTYVKSSINDDFFLTIIGTVGGIGNGCTRILWNLLFNKTGYKFVTLCIILLNIFVLATIKFTVDDKILYLFEVFFAYSCLGGFLVVTPTFSQYLFGPEVGSNIYGFFWETYSLANFLHFLFINTLKKSLGFDNIIYITLGMSVLSIPIVIFTKWQG